jgi:diacylglycerol kinase (ATP)
LRGKKLPLEKARQHIAELAQRAEPEPLEIRVDTETLTGGFLIFEVMTIPLVGPNLLLAPTADPADDLDVSYVGASVEERRRLSTWLGEPGTPAPAPVSTRVGQRVSISGRLHRVRLDDNVRLDGAAGQGTIVLMPEEKPLCFLVP